MSLRKKNLLEAFRRTDASSPPAGPPPAGGSSGPPASLFEGTPAPARARSGRSRDAAWALGAIGLVLAFVLGFVVGRNTQGEARAEVHAPADDGLRPRPTSQPRSFQERPPAGPGEAVPGGGAPAPGAERRIEDSPLFDPANVWTVIVASYTKSNQDLAWATYEHLRDARLPVFPPVESRNLVVVLAGAAPTSAELEKTETAVKALARDGRKKDYPDAYRARIDTLIPREKNKEKKGN
jgi:hypothetical protein